MGQSNQFEKNYRPLRTIREQAISPTKTHISALASWGKNSLSVQRLAAFDAVDNYAELPAMQVADEAVVLDRLMAKPERAVRKHRPTRGARG